MQLKTDRTCESMALMHVCNANKDLREYRWKFSIRKKNLIRQLMR